MQNVELAVIDVQPVGDTPPNLLTNPPSEDDIIGALIANGLDAYLKDVTKQDGIFSGYPAKFRYGVELAKGVWVPRIDVIYPNNDDKHGHLVVKGGEICYWRLPGGTVLINNR